MPADPDQRSSRHIVMIGAMGCGKTTVGRLVAGDLDRPFLDNDRALVAQEGSTAAVVAEQAGIDELHRLEADLLLEQLDTSPPAVIAAAASVVEDPRTLAALAQHATTVWLRGDPEVLVHRAQRSAHRPLLDEPGVMVALAQERAASYEQVADLVLDVSTATPVDSARRIVDFVRK